MRINDIGRVYATHQQLCSRLRDANALATATTADHLFVRITFQVWHQQRCEELCCIDATKFEQPLRGLAHGKQDMQPKMTRHWSRVSSNAPMRCAEESYAVLLYASITVCAPTTPLFCEG
jgi:hypothetical protein